MKIKYTSFAHYVKLLLDLLFIIGLVFLIASPFLKNNSYDIFRSSPIAYVFDNIFGILIATDIAILYVLYELRKIFKSIKDATPFIESNSKSLFHMGITSFVLAFVFIIKLFVYQTILTYAMVLVLIIAGCFSFTLSALFKEATRVKEENDLTI